MGLQVACEPFLEPDEITCDCDTLSDDEIQDLINTASDIIAVMTGGTVSGRCTELVRPRGPGSCGCGEIVCGQCACSPISGIPLQGPNPEIKSIMIDGEPFIDYAIVGGATLIRTDRKGWPGCQDIRIPVWEKGSFEIEYSHGLCADSLVKAAAIEIVCSFITTPAQGVRNPHPNTRGMSIAGVQINLEVAAMEIKRRTFLMPNVIRMLTVYSPDGPTPAVVYSPEIDDWRLHHIS